MRHQALPVMEGIKYAANACKLIHRHIEGCDTAVLFTLSTNTHTRYLFLSFFLVPPTLPPTGLWC
jgi:hypothetical protein